MATGLVESSTNKRRGGLSSISFRGWCEQQLKLLALYLSRIYCLNFSTFSGVGGHGSIGGVDGGSSLGGQEQGVVSGIGTPELEHFIVAIVGETSSELSHAPTSGKEEDIMPRSMQQFRLMYGLCTNGEM